MSLGIALDWKNHATRAGRKHTLQLPAMTRETEIGGDEFRFQPTAWNIVQGAKAGSREALDRLIAVYWKPVYAFIRRRGHDVESAKDLTQGFFASVLERDFFQAVRADKGRFRSYLLGALAHYLSDAYDRARAKRRGGDWNFVHAEADLASVSPTPEEAFRALWARETLSRAMARLRSQVPAADLALLAGDPRTDLSITERKSRLFQLRARLRDCLREQILESVDRAQDVDSEIREMFAALS
jgi:RNA polymerase sigma-70 factor (ECF subfamily)